MAYSNAWSHTIPLGSEAAAHIDDAIRQLRLDIEERMNTIIVDFTADPIVLKPLTSGDVVRYIPFSLFQNDLHAKENDLALGSIHAFQGNGPYVCALSAFLPLNATVNRIGVWIDRDAAHTVTMTLYQIPFVTGAASVPAAVEAQTTVSTSLGTFQLIDTGDLTVGSHQVAFDPNTMYTLALDASGGSSGDSYEIYGAKINFTLH